MHFYAHTYALINFKNYWICLGFLFSSPQVHQAHKYKGLGCDRLDMKLLELLQLTAKSIIPAILHVSMSLFNYSCPCFKSKYRCFTEISIKSFFITAFFHLMHKTHVCLSAGKQCLHIPTMYMGSYNIVFINRKFRREPIITFWENSLIGLHVLFTFG